MVGGRAHGRTGRAAGLVVAAALVLTGCGGGDGGSKGGGSPRAVWGAPTGAFAGKPPKAVLMLIHGGGWEGPNQAAFQSEVQIAQIFRRLGYETLTIEYGKGAAGIADAERFYDRARSRFGKRMPICAIGGSAGGQVALMLAVRKPELTCVIALGAPTDLPALASEQGGSTAHDIAERAFGDQLAQFSPARQARSIRARLMVVAAENDPLVPVGQATAMARARPGTQTILLPAGARDGHFVHGPVDAQALANASRAEIEFLAAAVKRARSRTD